MALAAPTLSRIFEGQTLRYTTRTFVSEKHDGKWHDHSWSQIADRAKWLRAGLQRLGVKHGDRVAILSENSPQWVIVDQAILGLGAIVVPLYTTSGAEEMRHVITDSGARLIAVNGEGLIAKVQGLGPLPEVEGIVAMHGGAEARDAAGLEVVTIDQLSTIDQVRAIEGDGRDLATLIYTSGTTGPSKGVMLSHRNLIANCDANLVALDLRDTDVILSFLPIAHSFERTAGYYTVMGAGGTIAYAEGLAQIAQNLLEIEPTVLLTVPRLLEAVYDRIMRKVASSSMIERAIFAHAIKVGGRAAARRHHRLRPPLISRLQMPLYRRRVFARIKAVFGSRLRYLIAGGAPLPIAINQFFTAAEVPLVEGYGLTEAAPVVSCNLHGRTRIGTVGRALSKIDVRTAEDGELLVRGDNVMQGYWERDEETREALDAEGWLHTGDVARIDADGYIAIIDRKKEIIVLSGGKNVSPANLETRLVTDPFIAQACVIGDRRKHLAAILVPNFDSLREQQAQVLELDGQQADAIVTNPKVREFFHQRVREFNRPLSDVEAIADFVLIPEPFSQENGELTPTMKVRRKVVQEHYRTQIEALYGG
jgi:long-chain acyl-CoA synthetase